MSGSKRRRNLDAKEKRQLIDWAKSALHGVDDSAVFLSIDAGADDTYDAARIRWLLQLAHCIVTNKPIILTCPRGHALPPKLAATADHIVYYNADDPETMQLGLLRAFTELGLNKQ